MTVGEGIRYQEWVIGNMLVLLLIIPVLCFLAVEAFFSGSETAIISANKMRLKALADRGDRRAKLASRLLKRPERVLGTTLVGTNVAVATSTTLAAVVVASLLRSGYVKGLTDFESTITTLIMTPLILILGEISHQLNDLSSSLMIQISCRLIA